MRFGWPDDAAEDDALLHVELASDFEHGDVLQAKKKTINMKSNSCLCLLGLSYQEIETAYGRMEMFISFYKGEIERD